MLPEAVTSLFRYLNQTVNSDDLKYAFKFGGFFSSSIEGELLMKLQFNLQQRYLSILK